MPKANIVSLLSEPVSKLPLDNDYWDIYQCKINEPFRIDSDVENNMDAGVFIAIVDDNLNIYKIGLAQSIPVVDKVDKTKLTSPKTGDNSNMILWVALFFISSGAVATLTSYSKHKKRQTR